MNSTTVAVDLAKNVFELAVADAEWRIVERHRLNRARFAPFFVHRPPCQVVMEACGSAHHWARRLVAEGHTVRLLPAHCTAERSWCTALARRCSLPTGRSAPANPSTACGTGR
jgi:transposase